jgi:phosphoribosylformylglycinamidine cyclo-ligase
MTDQADNAPRRPLTYAEAGVSIDAGDEFASAIIPLMRRTFGPRVLDNPGGFAGMFRLDYNERLFKRNYKDPVLVACADGVGTKIKLAIDTGIYDTLGLDLVAMNVNDLIVQNAEPLFFLDYIAVGKVDDRVLQPLIAGVAKGCEIAGAALLGGETAEMSDLYRPGDFDLAGFAVGVVELHRAMDAERVEPGDVVLALASSGVHSNGYTLVRRILENAGVDPTGVDPALDPDRPVGRVLLEPTRIYADPIVRVQRSYRVKKVITGMAHITGGGLAGNLKRALHPGVDAELDERAWETPRVFEWLQRRGDVDDDEMRRVFNMGVGYCLIVRPTFASSIEQKLTRQGETVWRIGEITRGEGRVTIRRR